MSNAEKVTQRSKGRKIFNFFLKNWIVSSIISVVPIIVSLFVDLWLPDLLPMFWIIVLSIISLVSVIFTVVKNICTSIDDKKRQNADKYYQSLTQRHMGTTGDIIESIVEVISDGEYRNIVSDPIIPFAKNNSRINPCSRIRSFCNDVKVILARHFDTSEDDIGISIFVRNIVDDGENAQWAFLYQTNVAKKDLRATVIAENSNSSFGRVKNAPGTVYFREKENAYNEHHYMPTEDEMNNGVFGTIYCENISIVDPKENVLLPLVLCVTTYKTRVCSDKDFFAVEKAKQLLAKVGLDLKYEIITLLLYKHMGIRRKLIEK